MKLDKLIKDKFGSVDKMLEQCDLTISRSYIYKIIGGDKTNLSVDVARELVKLLDLESIESLMEIINYVEEV